MLLPYYFIYLPFQTDDVSIVFAKEATEEQKKKAKELMLPLNFFLYENAPPCPGCRGCENDDDTPVATSAPASVTAPAPKSDAGLKFSFAASTPSAESKTTSSAPFNFMNMAESKVSGLSFSSLASSSQSGFNKPSTFSWSGAGAPVFVSQLLIQCPIISLLVLLLIDCCSSTRRT